MWEILSFFIALWQGRGGVKKCYSPPPSGLILEPPLLIVLLVGTGCLYSALIYAKSFFRFTKIIEVNKRIGKWKPLLPE